jgi:predicted TIM-barrel fold metal-dependent hydrolase
MLIDAHQHVGYLGYSTQRVVAEMDELGIDCAWLLTWYLPSNEDDRVYHGGCDPRYARADGTHAAMPLENLLDARDRHPARFVAGYCPCPTEGDAAALFEAAYRIHGVRVCGEWSYRSLLDDPRSIRLFHKAGELKCPVVLHIDVPEWPDGKGRRQRAARWYGGPIDALERALQACPETIFIGHAPGFWRYLSGDEHQSSALRPTSPVTPGGRLIAMLDGFPNLWADLSAGSGLVAMSRDTGHAASFITRYADRLLFGRDQYGDALHRLLESLDLAPDVREKVCFRNAVSLVPLPVSAHKR